MMIEELTFAFLNSAITSACLRLWGETQYRFWTVKNTSVFLGSIATLFTVNAILIQDMLTCSLPALA